MGSGILQLTVAISLCFYPGGSNRFIVKYVVVLHGYGFHDRGILDGKMFYVGGEFRKEIQLVPENLTIALPLVNTTNIGGVGSLTSRFLLAGVVVAQETIIIEGCGTFVMCTPTLILSHNSMVSRITVYIFLCGVRKCILVLLEQVTNTFPLLIMTIEKHCYGGKDDTGGTKAKVVGMNTSVVPKIDVEFCRERKRDLIGNARALGRSRIACNRAKRTIYSTAQTTTEVDSLFKGIESYAIITWARFEELCLSMLFKSMEPVGKCLNEDKVDNVHMQEMVLVSRSSRLPIIQHLLMNYIDEKKLYASINLDDDTTCGAAVLDTILIGNGDENVQELLVVDVTLLWLDVETVGRTIIVLISRNATISANEEQIFPT
ncbi:hypothetical protein BC332_03609 [Capsicum chinense]|nr:hypothetical protein BC332_03609 [Capsicum chinense]